MTRDDAIRKAMACLRLAQSPNQNEAALAAAKAQEIMDRFQLDSGMLKENDPEQEPDEDIKNFTADPLAEARNWEFVWVLRLASVVARHNACRVYYCSPNGLKKQVKIIGRPSDVAATRYIFGWLERQIQELTKTECAGNSGPYRKAFKCGVVETISNRLHEQRKATIQEFEKANSSMALVLVKQSIARLDQRGEEVSKLMASMGFKSGRGFNGGSDSSGREHGRKAGQSIKLTQARGGIGAGRKEVTA